LGWTGICIEPHPEVFKRLRANRACICENVAVAREPGTARFLCVSGYGEMLSGFAGAGIPDRVADAVKTTKATVHEIDVPCLTVSQILKRNHVDRVDYVSLDIEGVEFEILQTIDLVALRVAVVTVENNYADDRVELFLRGCGFRLVRILGNDGLYTSTAL
jgi:FkbM family methyltransferase